MAVPFQGDLKQLNQALSAYENPMREASGEPGTPITELDSYVARAKSIWQTQEGPDTSDPDWLAIFNSQDSEAYLVVERFFANRRVALGPDQLVFNLQTGELIDQFNPLPIHRAANWIEGLHWIQFDHWLLRWLYFLAGLSGCVMIGSGLIFWINNRVKKSRPDPLHLRLVRAVSVGSVTGIIIASAGFLLANRLIPKQLALDGIQRHELEIWVFFALWILCFIHAGWRDKAAWHEQSWAIAILTSLAVVMNWLTTKALPFIPETDQLWSVAIMDMLMLVSAGLAAWTAARLNNPLKSTPPQTMTSY